MDAAIQIIRDALRAGDDEVALNGVGKFVRKVRPARVRMNPATKERIEVPETVAVSFKVSKEFRKSINQ